MSEQPIPVHKQNWLTSEQARQKLGLKSVHAVTKRCRLHWQKQGLAEKVGDGTRGIWKISPRVLER